MPSALLFIPWFKLEPIELGPIPLQPFGLLVAVGVIAGARLSEWRAERVGIRREVVSDLITYVVATGFIFGHMFDMVLYHPQRVLEAPWELLMPWKRRSAYGGFFGAVLGGFIWKRRRTLPLLPGLDAIAFGLSLGWLFGRTGCFVVHDHPGKVTDFFLAVADYRYGEPPYLPRHDLGLYEVIWSAGCVALFMWLQRKPRPHGFFIGMIVVLYAPVRFGLDFLRVDDRTFNSGLTPGHYSSMVAFALGIWVLRRALTTPQEPLPEGMRIATSGKG